MKNKLPRMFISTALLTLLLSFGVNLRAQPVASAVSGAVAKYMIAQQESPSLFNSKWPPVSKASSAKPNLGILRPKLVNAQSFGTPHPGRNATTTTAPHSNFRRATKTPAPIAKNKRPGPIRIPAKIPVPSTFAESAPE